MSKLDPKKEYNKNIPLNLPRFNPKKYLINYYRDAIEEIKKKIPGNKHKQKIDIDKPIQRKYVSEVLESHQSKATALPGISFLEKRKR